MARVEEKSGCVVCGSPNHGHCSHGCQICDNISNPQPKYAWTRCRGCKLLLCVDCLREHRCVHCSECGAGMKPNGLGAFICTNCGTGSGAS